MLYEERPCKHGRLSLHALPASEAVGGIDSSCPGGSRREVSLDMVAVIDHLIEEFAITDMVDRDTLLAHAYDMELAALRGDGWKECDNCPNQVPVPRALCPVCEVTGRPPVSSSRDGEET